MLKWVGLAGVAVLTAAIILVARYDQNYDKGSKGYDIKCEQPSQPTAASASLACTIQPSQDAEQSKSGPPWGYKLLAWPEGITAWLLMLTLGAIIWQAWETRKAAEAAEKQITLQSAALRQWVNVVPLGIDIPRALKNPCEVTVQFEVQNKTEYLVTIKEVEFELIPNIHSIGKFKVDCNFALVPRKSEADSAFPFAGKCVVDLGELEGWGKIFIVAGDIKFLDCMERDQAQHFQDLYRGFIDGRLERMKPSSIEGTKDEPENQDPN